MKQAQLASRGARARSIMVVGEEEGRGEEKSRGFNLSGDRTGHKLAVRPCSRALALASSSMHLSIQCVVNATLVAF